jgi:phospholipid N-methyltransferase
MSSPATPSIWIGCLEKHAHRVSDVAVVFSSLPLRNLEPRDATRLVNKIRAVLRPDGRLIQYSYHLGNQTRQRVGAVPAN